MKAFDFENNNPIGYVDILPNGNANIDKSKFGEFSEFRVF